MGINATRLFSVLYHRTLNVGRVQTPTLAMLAERDEKIMLFKKEKYQHVRLQVDGAEAVSEKFTDPAQAKQVQAACQNGQAICTSVTRERKKEQPPKLYDLTTLQREANRIFGYTAKQTLDYAQSLYEKKLLTYPRTDSRYLTSDMAETAACVIHLAAKVPPFDGCGSFFPLVELMVSDNLSFACSLRMGEILGLTWDNVHISDEDIAADNAYVYVDKELTRASKRAIETLGEKDIYYIFTPLMPNTSTRIILKKPKTESSIRKVWLPKTLAYILREWKSSQDELRSFLGDEYQDFNLVVALPNGRPCEDRIILKEFSKLREEAGLPRVVFHSLRHSSTTYKLKLNHGDLKATQGDTGHAEIDMITSIYAHILDEDRKVNAQKFETAFYANPDLRGVRPPEEPKQPEPAPLDLASLVEQLQKSPELASALAALIAAQAPAK